MSKICSLLNLSIVQRVQFIKNQEQCFIYGLFAVIIIEVNKKICKKMDEQTKNGHFPENLKLLFVSKKVFSKSLLLLDVGDIIYVCFFLVLSSSSVFTNCIQSDLSLDTAKMVTFQKN